MTKPKPPHVKKGSAPYAPTPSQPNAVNSAYGIGRMMRKWFVIGGGKQKLNGTALGRITFLANAKKASYMTNSREKNTLQM